MKKQQIFKSERHNVLTEETNKITLSWNDDRRMQLTDSIEAYAHGMNKNLVFKKEEIKCNNVIKQYKNVELWLYYKKRYKIK